MTWVKVQWEDGDSKVPSDSKRSDAKSGESPPRLNQHKPIFKDREGTREAALLFVLRFTFVHLFSAEMVELVCATFLIKLSYYH